MEMSENLIPPFIPPPGLLDFHILLPISQTTSIFYCYSIFGTRKYIKHKIPS